MRVFGTTFRILLMARGVMINCRASKKKKSEIEAAARKWQQVHDRFESQRQSLIENESNMVRTLGLFCSNFKH